MRNQSIHPEIQRVQCIMSVFHRPFARWSHFTTTTTTRILERKNEINSGLSSKKRSSCKWPIRDLRFEDATDDDCEI